MSNKNTLIPIEQKQIPFQGGEVTAVLVQGENGRENVYVFLKPLVESLGLDWRSQRKRIRRNPVLNDFCSVVMMTTERGKRSTTALPLSKLNGFLFGIDASRVADEIRPLLIEYQQKCYEILFHAFNGAESMRRFYAAVGHDAVWTETRIEKHSYSTDLGDVWLLNGLPIEYHEELQSIINTGAFGLTLSEHKNYKNLPEDSNLQDNMSRVELLVSSFGDEATIQLIENEGPNNLDEHKLIASAGGDIAGKVRRVYEKEIGKPVLTSENHQDKYDDGKPRLNE